ncbi:thioesterase II family protein [Streptomyces sp. 6N223]|uniref:thioesterase II family protein n=1 Tax=Streptomyces sp. 6N223 TaxID=3457412 RepID=UPI003FD33464
MVAEIDKVWLRTFAPAAGARIRLVCFPHAGGSASFYIPMSRSLAPGVEVLAVQYPGRQDRRNEPLVPEIGRLADRLAEVLRPLAASGPLAFFGHSMGAVVAFETARRMERDGGTGPVVLFASGRRAPGIVREAEDRVHQGDDDAVIEEMRTLSGTEAAVFADDELLRMVLPAIRNDYQAIETYRAEPEARIGCRVVALIGDADPRTSVSDAKAWRVHTTDAFELHVFAGGHFFLSQHTQEIVERVMMDLKEYLAHPR